MPLTQKAAGIKHGWRSGLEEKNGEHLTRHGVPFKYEELTGEYLVPAKRARYTPDIVLTNGIVIETKGRWVTADRQKIRLIRDQFPDLDLRMVFSNPNARISKQSKTTYAKVCEDLGIPYAHKLIPLEWAFEPNSPSRWRAIERFRWAGAKQRKAA